MRSVLTSTLAAPGHGGLQWLAAAVVFVASARAAGAQNGVACRVDTSLVRDTIPVTIGIEIPTAAPDHPNEPRIHEAVARAIASHLEHHGPLSLPLWPGTYLATDTTLQDVLVTGAGGVLAFYRVAGQRQLEVRFAGEPGAPELATSLRRAIQAADSAGLWDSIAPLRGTDTVVVNVVTATRPVPTMIPLLRFRTVALRLSKPVVPIKIPKPTYPYKLRMNQVSGRVEVEYTVGADGQVAASSLRVLRYSHREFAESAINVLLRGRFKPAQLGTCPSTMRVHQVVSFISR